MKILDKLKEPFNKILEYLESEKELLKLKVVRTLSHLAGNFLAAVFMIVFFNVFMVILSVWFGIWMGGLLNSYAWGFGLSALIFLLMLIILVRFRKALLVKPFENLVIQTAVDLEDIQDEEKEKLKDKK